MPASPAWSSCDMSKKPALLHIGMRKLKRSGKSNALARPAVLEIQRWTEVEIAVEELADGEFAIQGAEVEQRWNELRRDPLHVVEPVALDVEARVIQSALASRPLKQWLGRLPVDRGEVVAEA